VTTLVLIADTHGLIRPEAVEALDGVDLIVHAGDVGGRAVLHVLRRIAPVYAVFGNVDDPSDPDLRASVHLEVDGLSLHVSHGHEVGRPAPDLLLRRYPEDIIVFGHTHRALEHRDGRRLVINPGAAGPRRFDLRPGVALLKVKAGQAQVEFVQL
jgi:putative phosphoesterase